MASEFEFISELVTALTADLVGIEVSLGNTHEGQRGQYVVINYDLNDADPEQEPIESMVECRVTFDCCSWNTATEALALVNRIRAKYQAFTGLLVPGGVTNIEVARRLDSYSAPIYEGDQTCHQHTISMLFMYQEN